MDFNGISRLLDSVIKGISPVWWSAGVAILIAIMILIILVLRRKPPGPRGDISDPAQRSDQHQEDGSVTAEIASPAETDGQLPAKGDAQNDIDLPGQEASVLEKVSPAPPPPVVTPAVKCQPVLAPVEPKPAAAPGLFGRLKNGLAKTRRSFSGSLDRIFSDRQRIDKEALEDLEELLITSDIGVQTATELIERITARNAEFSRSDDLKRILQEEILAILETCSPVVANQDVKPRVTMVVGVNGVGKTTTIGKLAARHSTSGKKVILAAADTFRAAAIEQLEIWAKRAGADIVKHRGGSDPAAVAYDSIEAALARGSDIVLVDTAGRLHTKINLMEELKKMRRTISKRLPGAPHDILLVLDATTGQNALSQARMFHDALGITAICLTKLDGTAKGGIVIATCNALQVPLAYIGVGESVEDLQDFEPAKFTEALF